MRSRLGLLKFVAAPSRRNRVRNANMLGSKVKCRRSRNDGDVDVWEKKSLNFLLKRENDLEYNVVYQVERE